jgi:hypothetical protein
MSPSRSLDLMEIYHNKFTKCACISLTFFKKAYLIDLLNSYTETELKREGQRLPGPDYRRLPVILRR